MLFGLRVTVPGTSLQMKKPSIVRPSLQNGGIYYGAILNVKFIQKTLNRVEGSHI